MCIIDFILLMDKLKHWIHGSVESCDRMNNAWQPQLDDAQKIQFYNPQHFHQPPIPQHETYPQSTTQLQNPQQNFNPSQAIYSYPQHYSTPQESTNQYGESMSQIQPHGLAYSSNQPFAGQDYGSAISTTSHQSYNTGTYGQVPYQFGARGLPELEMKDDEPNESHGDWNDIDLDRDLDEYQSSSSSDYGGDGIDQVLTSYNQGYNNSQVPVYPVSAASEQYQHAFMPASNIISHGYTDMVDANIPVNSSVPPPRPLPESLMLSGVGGTQSSVPQIPMNQVPQHDPHNTGPAYAVNEITEAVDDLTISSSQAPTLTSDRPISPDRNVEVNSVPQCEDKSNEYASNVASSSTNNPMPYDHGEYHRFEKDNIVHGSDVSAPNSYVCGEIDSVHLNSDNEKNIHVRSEMESGENATYMHNYVPHGTQGQSEIGITGVSSNENSANLGEYFPSETMRTSIGPDDPAARRKTKSTSSDHDTQVSFHSMQPQTVTTENISLEPSRRSSNNETRTSFTQENESICDYPNTSSIPGTTVTSLHTNVSQSSSTLPSSKFSESFNPLKTPQSPATSDVAPQFSSRNEHFTFGGQDQLPIQHQNQQLCHDNQEFLHSQDQQPLQHAQQHQMLLQQQQRQRLDHRLQQQQQHKEEEQKQQQQYQGEQQQQHHLHLQDSQHQKQIPQIQQKHQQQLQPQELQQQHFQQQQQEQESQQLQQEQQPRIQSARSSPPLLQNQQNSQPLYKNDPQENKPAHLQRNSVSQATSEMNRQEIDQYLQHQMTSVEPAYSQQPGLREFSQSQPPYQQKQPTLMHQHNQPQTAYQQQPQPLAHESQANIQQQQLPLSEEIHQPADIQSKESEDNELQSQLRRLELEELEIERRKKLLSLELQEQELKARKRELMQRKQGSSQPSQVQSQSLPPLNDRLEQNILTSSESQTPQNESPIQSQPRKQPAPPRLDSQRKSARTQQVIKPSEELRQIMSNMRPSPKKAPSIASARGPSRQSSVMSDKNSADNSDIMSARKSQKEKSKNRAGDFSLPQYQMYRPYGMSADPMYGANYHDNSSRAGSEYGAPIERSPSRGSNASYEPWQQMYMQQQQAWYHHYHNNKRGETGYGGWSFATGWPSFEQWYHAMYMQQNQAYYQWWEQYYAGGVPSGSQGDSGYLGYPGYPGFGMWGPADQSEIDRSGRGTPRRYLTAHCAISLNLAGVIIQVCPNRPDEGEPARVQLLQIPIMDREESNYVVFPGPLQRSETIPSDVRAFLRTKYEDIQRRMPADLESAYLLIAYLELLIKNRGTVLGIDIVDLLLEGHIPRTKDLPAAGPLMRTNSYESLASLPPSGRSTPLSGMSAGGAPVGITDTNVPQVTINTQERSLDDYRKLLLCGRKRQALHYACKHSLWGHALYLAQEMGPDVIESIRSRFIKESVNPHDPTRTLYQFSGGLIPEVSINYSTSVSGNWGDWRPHLAMLVANQDENPELAASSIIHLGDSLGAQQLLFASQLCYLIAGCEFGILDNKNAKISMISIDHRRNQSLIADEAIQLTEVFEYAMSLAHRDYCIPSFQLYKFIYATRLLDAGLVEESFKYLSVLGSHLIRTPQWFSSALADAVLALGDRLQYHPVCVDEYSRDWVEQLRSVRQHGQFGAALDDDGNMLHGSRPVVYPSKDQTDGFVQNEQYQSAHLQSNDSAGQQNQYFPQAQQQQNEQLQQSTFHHQQQQQQPQQAYHSHQTNVYQQPHVQQQQVSSFEDNAHHHEIQSVPQPGQPLSQTDNTKSHGDSQPSTSYQHRDVVSQAIPEQPLTAEPAGPTDNVAFFNPSASQQSSMHFYSPSGKPAASDSAPPSPGSTNPHGGDAFDYFSSVNQLVHPGRQRTVSGSSSSGGPSSPSASISLGQGAFKTYTRQSPTRSRTTSVASSGGQRSRHSSAADHAMMPPPARPAPRKVTGPSMDVQNPPPQQTSNNEDTAPDQNPNESENQRGVFKKLIGFFRPHNEVHLPDDKKPAIVWDSQKKVWVNQTGPDESTVVTAPPKLSQMPNPGEMNFRSGGISGRGSAGRYVDVLAQSKSTSGTSGSQMPPMLSSNPGQGMMAPPMPVPSMPQNRTSGISQPQFFTPGPALSQPMPQ